jgi:protein-S-isoprenylcysteine O-methyltransferase Ste14
MQFSLERKVPPPIVALVVAWLMWVLAREVGLQNYEVPYKSMICAVLVMLGLIVDFSALWLFAKAKTTVNPISPSKATSLVTTGVYRYTRNPMYMGNFIFLLAWLIWMGSAYGVIGLILYVVYMNQFQIKPEESVLLNLFGKQYSQFCSQVRRWI